MIERGSDQISPREYSTWEHEKEVMERQMAHQIQMKELSIEADKLEAKITSWFKLPIMIIKLPVFLIFVIPITVYAVTHQEIPEFYRRFFR